MMLFSDEPGKIVQIGNMYALDYNSKGWLRMKFSTLEDVLKDLKDSCYNYEVIGNENMNNNIITFDNKEYVWEDIKGVGRSLVPVKKTNRFTFPMFKVGQIYSFQDDAVNKPNSISMHIVSRIGSRFFMVCYDSTNKDLIGRRSKSTLDKSFRNLRAMTEAFNDDENNRKELNSYPNRKWTLIKDV